MLSRTHVLATITLALSMLAATDALAAGQRSFVSGSGADVGTCTLTAPCRSFGYAIAQTNLGGEVIVLDSAGYGPVTITGAVKLIAPPGVYAGISVSSGAGITVNAGASDVVVLRGLSINNIGAGINGIQVANGVRVTVDHCAISGFSSGAGIASTAAFTELDVTDTVIYDSNTGVELVNTGFLTEVTLRRVRISAAGVGGIRATGANLLLHLIDTSITTSNNAIWLDPAPNNTIRLDVQRGELVANQIGVFAEPFGANSNIIGVIADTLVADNFSAGIVADSAGGGHVGLSVTNCVLRHNGTGLSAGAATIVFRNNLIVDNGVGIDGGALLTGLGNTLYNNLIPGTPTGTVPPI